MIRPAIPDDAKAVAEVHVKSWQAIYRGHFPGEFLDSLSVEGRAENWARLISHGASDTGVFEFGAAIVGFVSLENSRDEDARSSDGEVTSIYVHPDHWQRGIGSALIQWATHQAAQRKWEQLTLWVLRENSQARAFYERRGFTADGSSKDAVLGDGTPFVEVRYVLPLLT